MQHKLQHVKTRLLLAGGPLFMNIVVIRFVCSFKTKITRKWHVEKTALEGKIACKSINITSTFCCKALLKRVGLIHVIKRLRGRQERSVAENFI